MNYLNIKKLILRPFFNFASSSILEEHAKKNDFFLNIFMFLPRCPQKERKILVVPPAVTSPGYQMSGFLFAIRPVLDGAHFQLPTFALLQLPNEPFVYFPDPVRAIIDNAEYHIGIDIYSKEAQRPEGVNPRTRLACVAVEQKMNLLGDQDLYRLAKTDPPVELRRPIVSKQQKYIIN